MEIRGNYRKYSKVHEINWKLQKLQETTGNYRKPHGNYRKLQETTGNNRKLQKLRKLQETTETTKLQETIVIYMLI